jgi:hypothetical protein
MLEGYTYIILLLHSLAGHCAISPIKTVIGITKRRKLHELAMSRGNLVNTTRECAFHARS